LQTLLEPLVDPQANVQPNLVTRDGELSIELHRMRVLIARVAARVSEMDRLPKAQKVAAPRPGTVQTDRQKLASIMEMT